jgi:hypothetical protein
MKLTTEQTANLIDVLNAQSGLIKIKDPIAFKRKMRGVTPFLLHKDGKFIGGVTMEIFNENKSNRDLMAAIKRQLEKAKAKKDVDEKAKINSDTINRTRAEAYSHRNKLRIIANIAAEEKANEIYQADFEESMEEINEDMRETIESLREELEEIQQEADNGDIDLQELETGIKASDVAETTPVNNTGTDINTPTDQSISANQGVQSTPGTDPGAGLASGAGAGVAGSITDPANAIATISNAAEEIMESIDKVLKEEESKEELLMGQTNQPNSPSVTTPEAMEAALPTVKSGRNMSPLERARLLAAEITQMIQKKKAVTKKRKIQEPEPGLLGMF